MNVYYGAPYNLLRGQRSHSSFASRVDHHHKRVSDAILNAVSDRYPVEVVLFIVPRNIPEIQHYRTRARARDKIDRIIVREKLSVEPEAVLTGG